MDYIRQHWRGELPILQAFWINLVLVRAVFLLGDLAFQPPVTPDVEDVLFLALAYYTVNLLIVYPWQIRGLLRATDRLVGEVGSAVAVHLINFSIVLSLLFTGVSLYSTFQPLAIDRPAEPHWVTSERERAERYSIQVRDGGTGIEIQGDFELGLTRDLREALAANPGVREIVLDSSGGYVNQARAVANLIEERNLATRVDNVCESACVVAFMAGSTRRLAPLARLGFHQYRYAGRTAHPLIDIEEEMRRDRAYLVKQGADPAFAERAYTAVNAAIWYPERDLLLSARVVNAITD